MIANARNEEHIQIVRKWLDGEEQGLKAHSMRKIDKWSIVKAIYRSKKIDLETKEKYYAKVYQEDPSDTGKRAKMFCDALVADDKQREAIWAEFMDDKTKKTYPHLAEMMLGFSDERNISTLGEYYEKFWDNVFAVFDSREDRYCLQFFAYLFPSNDNLLTQIKKIQELKKLTPKNEKAWKKVLSDKEQEIESRIEAYKKVGIHPNL